MKGIEYEIEGVEFKPEYGIRKEEFSNTLIFIDNSFENNRLKKSVLKYITESCIESFEINDVFIEEKVNGTFLYSIPNIKRLKILTTDFLGIDFTDNSFLGLKYLSIIADTDGIDFTKLKLLEEVDTKWSNSRKGVLDCCNLKKLILRGFKGNNLNNFMHLKLLEELELISANVENLEGIEKLGRLKNVEFHYCKKLNNLSSLNTLKNLEILILGNLSALTSLSFVKNLNQLIGFSVRDCKKLDSSDDLLHLNNLIFLGIHNAGVLTSLKPIVNFKQLKRLTLGQTKILDGDVSPILKLKSIEYIQFADSKNFNYKLTEIRKIMNVE